MSCTFPIPDFVACDLSDAPSDIEITKAVIDQNWQWPGQSADAWASVSPNFSKIRLDVENCGSFLITEGKSIQFCADARGSSKRVMAYLLGRVLGAVFYQREQFLLHASAIKLPHGVLLFTGERGAGKSTLTMQFGELGYPLWTDDVSRVMIRNGKAMMPAGIQRNKLWSDALEWFKKPVGNLQEVEEQLGKFYLPTHQKQKGEIEEPVLAIFELSKEEASEISVSQIPKLDRFKLIAQHSYMFEFIPALGLEQEFLDYSVLLQGSVPFYRFAGPRGFDHIEGSARHILKLFPPV